MICCMNKAYADFSIQRWLEELPDEEIEREMKELNDQIQALAARHNTLREALELKQRFRNLYNRDIPTSRTDVILTDRGVSAEGDTISSVTKVSGEETPRPSSISKSVLLLMESNPEKREWAVRDIYSGLVERGWLEDSNQAERSLLAALSRMAKEGEIRRASRGLYAQISPTAASPSLLDSEGGASG
jgi:hypothetical protein